MNASLSKRACVIGWPVAHSLSPVIHGFWLNAYGINGEYIKCAVELEGFEAFVRTMPAHGFAGGNVTVPHKIAAYNLCDVRDVAAERIGAVNTLWFEDGRLHGTNTDAIGFSANLDEKAAGWHSAPAQKAVVIGAGGAARAILWALIARGFSDIVIVNRTFERAQELARAFAPAKAAPWEARQQALEGATLVVNTSSLGMTGAPPLPIDLSPVASNATVCDIVYAPLETALLAAGLARGLRCVDGLGMLLHQAVPGFEKWFGIAPQVTCELRAAVLDAIAQKQIEAAS